MIPHSENFANNNNNLGEAKAYSNGHRYTLGNLINFNRL